MSRFFLVVVLGLAMLGLVIFSQYQVTRQYVSGIIEAEEIRLGSRVGGRIATIHVTEGDMVEAGKVLLEFEPYDLLERERQAAELLQEKEAALKQLEAGNRTEEIGQAKAFYDEALANLELVRAGPRAEEIAAARDRLAAAQSDQKLAGREFERVSELYRNQAISQSEYDSTEERLQVSNANVRVRTSELTILEAGPRKQEVQMAEATAEQLRLAWELARLGPRPEEIDRARAARNAAQAGLEAVQKQRQELQLTSPTGGTIDSLDLQPGDLVPANAPVLTLLAPHEIWVRAHLPQSSLQIKVGQTLRVTADSFPGQEFQGQVSFVSQQAEFTPSNVQTPDDRSKQLYRIRVSLPNVDRQLRPGMTVNVWLDEVKDAS